MNNKVYFIKINDNESDSMIAEKTSKVLNDESLLSFIAPKDLVAIKTHFGEKDTSGFVRPIVLKKIAELVIEKKGKPFLAETSTLYRGNRSNAVDHIKLAHDHGFSFENTGMPIIMADGLLGDEETGVNIEGELFKEVFVASQIEKAQSLILVSHFTGHLLAGFGAAIKNLGMGCVSRKGKLIQHSTAKPSIRVSKCTGCGMCMKWCPKDAISMKDKKASIKNSLCIGCGECLAVCNYDAVGYNWSETYENLQKKIAEHALGVTQNKKNKVLYLNFLNRISKECDCMGKYEKISDDIGILISTDPVAIDKASLDLFFKYNKVNINEKAFNIPYMCQIDHGQKIDLGNREYELIESSAFGL